MATQALCRNTAGHFGRACLLVCTFLGSVFGDKLAVEYRVPEQQSANTTIGYLSADVALEQLYTEDELRNLRYHLVTVVWNQPLSSIDDGLSYFTLDAHSGLLITSKAVQSYYNTSGFVLIYYRVHAYC